MSISNPIYTRVLALGIPQFGGSCGEIVILEPVERALAILYKSVYNIRMSENLRLERTTGVAALSEARERLSEIVEEVAATGGEFLITKHGRPTAVLLSNDGYESLIETLNILSDNDAMAAIREAEADLAAGDLIDLD